MIKTLVVDFDGVIVRRSEFFKQETWPIVFSAYGASYLPHFKKAEQKFGGGRGGDRFDILRETYRGLGVPEEKIKALVEAGGRVFDNYVQAKIAEDGADAEVVRVLEKLSARIPIYVNSATPVDALERTIANLGIAHLFRSVLGQPLSKVENFRLAATAEKCAPGEILFIGDSDSDVKAAQEFVCQFIGYANECNGWAGTDKSFPVIISFAELDKHL